MKMLSRSFIGMLVVGLFTVLATASLAKGMHEQADVDSLKKAVKELQTSNPELATNLAKYADMEAKEMADMKTGKMADATMTEDQKKAEAAEHQSNAKLLQDSAAALKATDPELATKLTSLADAEAGETGEGMMKEDMNTKTSM